MATILAAASGPWSDPATWAGGVLPGPSDIAAANGKTITIDTDVSVVTVTNAATGGAVAGGGFTVTGGAVSLTATGVLGQSQHPSTVLVTVTGGHLTVTGPVTSNAASAIVVEVTNAAVTVNGAVSCAATASAGIRAGAGTAVTVNGNVTGGTAGAAGVYIIGSGTSITVNGNVTAAAAYGVYSTAAGTSITVNGSVTGGASNATAYGVYSVQAGAVLTITGPVTAAAAPGVYAAASAAVIDLLGGVTASPTAPGVITPSNITDSIVRARGPLASAANGRVPIVTQRLLVHAGQPTAWLATDDSNSITGNPVPLSNALAGVPDSSDVRDGVAFGAGGTLTGTLAVPPADAVATGVPVDHTTGTAVLRPADVWSHDLAPGVTAGDRMLATASLDATSAIITAAVSA